MQVFVSGVRLKVYSYCMAAQCMTLELAHILGLIPTWKTFPQPGSLQVSRSLQGASVVLCDGPGHVESSGSAASKSDWLQPSSGRCLDCPCNPNRPQVCRVDVQSQCSVSLSVTVEVTIVVTVIVTLTDPASFPVTVTFWL